MLYAYVKLRLDVSALKLALKSAPEIDRFVFTVHRENDKDARLFAHAMRCMYFDLLSRNELYWCTEISVSQELS